MFYWYTLFVHTRFEKNIVDKFNKEFSKKNLWAFLPMMEVMWKKNGLWKPEIKMMFQSYVFIETEVNSHDFKKLTSEFIRRNDHIFKILSYGDSNEIAMREEERQPLLKLYNDAYTVELSKIFIQGDIVCVTEGPLKGKEGMIVKIDKHRRRVKLNLYAMGRISCVEVGMNFIEKMPDNTGVLN